LAKGNQVHIPLLCSQVRQKHPARLLPGSQQASVARLKSQAPIPSQAGTSCEAGASTARSRDGQPSPSSNSGRRETPGRSRHRFPGGPSTQDNSPIAHRASALNDRSLRGRGRPRLAAGVSGSARLRTFAQSQRPTPPSQTAARTWPPPRTHPGSDPPRQTPLSGSHLIGAHPPCSRKGPLLPACGPKRPWRVKREATNSRFGGHVGLCQISSC
jgi:hypothetical protein